jgi:hypothetical protein
MNIIKSRILNLSSGVVFFGAAIYATAQTILQSTIPSFGKVVISYSSSNDLRSKPALVFRQTGFSRGDGQA